MEGKVVCFAGPRYEWKMIGVEGPLRKTIEELILKGFTIFFDGGMGYFDKISATIVSEMKKKYPYIKLIRIMTYYHHNKEKWELSNNYDDSIYPDIECYHPKQKIIKKNEWMIDHCDVLVYHLYDTTKSGSYRTCI